MEICEKALEILKKKNHDYSYGEDPFKNFQLCENVGICKTEEGILVRLSDKLSRIVSLIKSNERLVKDESIEDTVIDMINYGILLLCILEDRLG